MANPIEDVSGYLNKVEFTLLSSTAGADAEVTTNRFNGILYYAVFEPDGGATVPTTLWDVVVTDDGGIDVLGGLGANLSESAVTYKKMADGLGAVKSSVLTCTASNMGEAKGAVVTLYIMETDD